MQKPANVQSQMLKSAARMNAHRMHAPKYFPHAYRTHVSVGARERV